MIDWLRAYDLHLIIRMLLSCVCGIAIGFERKNRSKEAGVRTHCIVACASALMMIISKYGFFDMIDPSLFPDADIRLDPSRMAQGIVTGVGFLGTGIIFVQRNTIIKGLTTAAGIWATSGIGMAIGAGMYMLGCSATVIILLTQIILHKKNKFMIAHKNKELKVFGVHTEGFQKLLEKELSAYKITATDVSITVLDDGTRDYILYIEVPNTLVEDDLVSIDALKGYSIQLI